MIFRKYVLLVFFIINVSFGYATHFIGGELSYRLIDSSKSSYEVALKLYIDCEVGNAVMPNDALIKIASIGDSMQIQINRVFRETVNPNEYSQPCLVLKDFICVEIGYFIDTLILPDTVGGYQLYYNGCCRNVGAVNIVSGDGYGVSLTIPDSSVAYQNSSPVFEFLPPIAVCLNETFSFNHSAIDIDGDSLVYRLCAPKAFESSSQTVPVTFMGGFNDQFPFGNGATSLDPITGVFQATPDVIGQYQFGICVDEYRNGVLIGSSLRDFQINVGECTSPEVSFESPSVSCGDTVNFNNTSLGNRFLWDFGDLSTIMDTSTQKNPFYVYPDTGMYAVTLIISPNDTCRDTVVKNIFITPNIFPNFTMIDTVCLYDSIVLKDVSITNDSVKIIDWTWFLANNQDTLNGSEVNYKVSNFFNKNMTLQITSELGCVKSLTKPLFINFRSIAGIDSIMPVCNGDPIAFVNTTDQGLSYFWDFGDLFINTDTSSLKSPAYTYSDTGQYNVLLIADGGSGQCLDSAMMQVVVVPTLSPGFLLSRDTICMDEPITLTDTSFVQYGGVVNQRLWTLGDGDTAIDSSFLHGYSNPGTYNINLELTTDKGCIKNISSKVIVNNLSIAALDIGEDSTSCINESICYDLSLFGVYTFDSSFMVSANQACIAVLDSQQMHTYFAEDVFGFGCKIMDTFSIIGLSPPKVKAIPDSFEVKIGEAINSEAIGNANQYSWLNSNLNNISIGSKISIIAEESTFIILQGLKNGCLAYDTIKIVVLFDPLLEIPSAFTPDGDGLNDELVLFSKDISEIVFSIYNRWGQKVFFTKDQSQTWDGMYDGKEQEIGVYTYQIEATFLDNNKVSKAGSLSLIR